MAAHDPNLALFEVIIQHLVKEFKSITINVASEIGERERSPTLVAAVLAHKVILRMLAVGFPSVAKKMREMHMFNGKDKYFTGFDCTDLDGVIVRRPWVMAVYSTGELINFECETIGGCKYCVRILTNALFKSADMSNLNQCINGPAMQALASLFWTFVCKDTSVDITIEHAA